LVLTHDEEEYLIAVNSEKEQDAWVTQIEGLKAGVQSLYWSKITNPGKPEPSARFNHSYAVDTLPALPKVSVGASYCVSNRFFPFADTE
jgi:hypothetical protein